MAELLNEEQLKLWILRRLGAPMVTIELDDCHLTDEIEYARRWFAAKKGVRRSYTLDLQAGQPEYALSDEIDTVEEVVFPLPPTDISVLVSPFLLLDEKLPYDAFQGAASTGLYSSYTQTIQYIEMGKRILGAEPDWLQEGRVLHLMPPPKNATKAIIFYKSHRFAIEQLNERDHDLVKRYALARAKEDLGNIWSKYAQWPSAQGTATLDGKRLLDESKAEIEQLEREIMKSAYPMPFITG